MYRLSGLGATALANAIFRQEGTKDAAGNWNTSSLGYRLNNPGNLNYAGQPGCHATTFGNGLEAECDSLDAGIAITDAQLALDASRGLTLAQRLQTWATGNKDAYVKNVSSWLDVDPNTPLSDLMGSTSSFSPPSEVDTGSTIDSWGSGDSSEGGLSTVAWVGVGIAGIALVWAVAS